MELNCRLAQRVSGIEMRIGGVEYVAIQKSELAVLYEEAPLMAAVVPALRAPAVVAPHKPAGKRHKVKHASVPALVAVDRKRPAPMQDAVMAALAKHGPLTSAELGELLGKDKLPSIYAALAAMRKSGEVVTAPDDNGTRKNALAKQAA